uniref:phenylalanine--tRNA ligase n=1 Tax=Chondria sp. (in: red algae) TaxID=1982705 RepID=A0A1Z1MDU8_9FLOR|nr:Phenylalanine-tRNA ligase beta subunit [Chondria sp. (in: red algae)]
MKFSWKLVSNFINTEHIQINELEEKLALSGIEIENVEYICNIKDIIFHTSITSNRKEICSVITFSKEISIILKTPLKILPIKKFTQFENTINKSLIMSVNTISEIEENRTPEWIQQALTVHDITNRNILNNIREYIKIKWGQTFEILNHNEFLKFINNYKNKSKNNIIHYILRNINKKNLFFVFPMQYKEKDSNNKYSEYYLNSYIDSLRTLATYTKCVIGKSYHVIDEQKYNTKTVEINKKIIKTTLGKVKNTHLKYISHKTTLNTLEQLYLLPKYNRLSKSFLVQVPSARNHDLDKQIDIIEEIARLQGFNNFTDQLPKNNKKGSIYRTSLKVKKIRKILRYLGLNEVINCSLTNNNFKKNDVKIHNPIRKDQCELRNSILQNLIENYLYNKKQINQQKTIEIFEIGKIFEKKSTLDYFERLHIGGLIQNNKFLRLNWSTKPSNSDFFHFKGLIEIFLEQLNVQVIFDKIHCNSDEIIVYQNINLFNQKKQIGIYSKKNQNELIGVIGELNYKYTKDTKINRNQIYIFEIDFYKLEKNIETNSHLNYRVSPYSNYPNVVRDISIKINKTTSIKSINEILVEPSNSLIQSIEIFNLYIDKESNMKSIGLRITYGSKIRTLNNSDVENIDIEINKLLLRLTNK